MNIALFASAFYPHVGGVEELVRQLAQQQQHQGNHPLIITNRWPKTLPRAEEYEGLRVRRYVFRVPERTLRQMSGALLYTAITSRHICQDLRAHGTQLIHVQCVSSNAHYALLAKRRLGLPLVVSLQGELTMDASGLFQCSQFARHLMRRALTEADAITACSAQTLAEAEDFFGQPFGERARVIYNGIRLEDFSNVAAYHHPRPYLFAIGRHVPQKGFDVLIRAFAMTVQAGQETHDLLLAGDGAERPALERLAAQLQLTERIHFLGRIDHAAAARLFVGCAFFVLPSRHEPMGIVNLEAMAAGKAVIASRVGGVPELIKDEYNGLLVSGDDVVALSRALTRLLSDKNLCDRLGQSGRAFVQPFDWPIITSQYLDVYQYACLHASRRRLHP